MAYRLQRTRPWSGQRQLILGGESTNPGRPLLSRAVDVCSMVDVDHVDRLLVGIDLVGDAIFPYPCRMKSRQVAPQRFAHPVWALEKRSQHVVDDCNGNLLGEAVDGSPCGSGN